MRVTELGCAGHLIIGDCCLWHRHTQIGSKFRVSTIGNYYPRDDADRKALGLSEYFFETMVFRTTGRQDVGNEGCGCLEVEDWVEIYRDRYATAGEAQAGHEKAVRKYKKIAKEE